MMSVFEETPVVLGRGAESLAATLHAPAVPLRSVLVLAPLVEERKACHRFLCETARRFAGEGAAVLRFDYRGNGDSAGDFSSFSVDDWLADAVAAHAWLCRRYPSLIPALLGLRFGAMLAARLSVSCAARLLIEPIEGAAFLRYLQQKNQVNQMIAFGKPRTTRAANTATWARGEGVDLDGYTVTARLAQDLALLDAAPWSEPGCVVSTSGDVRGADAMCALAPSAERHALRLPAFWNTVGQVDVSSLTDVLAEALLRWVPAHAGGTPGVAASGETCDGGAVTLPSSAGVIRGWVDRPAAPPRARVLFLHGWSGDRTGPHRMFVTAARALAAADVLSLRIDLAGRGESVSATATASIAAMTDDALAGLEWLRRTFPDGGPIVLVAICSGCKVAISAASSAPDVAALALWSAESMGALRSAATGRRKTLAALKTYALKLTRRETWLKLLTGRVRGGMVTKALVRHETRSTEEAVDENRTLRRFRAYAGRILFVFGGSDPDAAGSATAYAQFCRRHGIRHDLHTIPHAGHSFYAGDWEAAVLALTQTFVGSVADVAATTAPLSGCKGGM